MPSHPSSTGATADPEVSFITHNSKTSSSKNNNKTTETPKFQYSIERYITDSHGPCKHAVLSAEEAIKAHTSAMQTYLDDFDAVYYKNDGYKLPSYK